MIIEEAGKELRDKPELAQKAAIYLSHRYSGRSLREIGKRFAIGESAVSQASQRFESALKESRALRKMVRRGVRSCFLHFAFSSQINSPSHKAQ